MPCDSMKRSSEVIGAENENHQNKQIDAGTCSASEAESRSLPFKKRRFKVSNGQGPIDEIEKAIEVSQLDHSTSLTSTVSLERTKNGSSGGSDQNPSSPETPLDMQMTNDQPVADVPDEGEKSISANSAVPTGCHGRTTRTDTFCQRKPCYKGSNYCKLHYQQYVVFRIRSDKPAVVPTETGKSPDEKKQDEAVPRNDPPIQQERPKKLKYHDKCFTTTSTATDLSRIVGLPLSEQGTLRCMATTSRGHPCAYVAVHNTKYCFMHADYDTNPPRRRRPREARRASKIPTVQRGVDSLAVAVAPQMLPSLTLNTDQAIRLTVSPSSVFSVNTNFRQGPSPSLFMPRLWGAASRPAPTTETSMVFLSQLSKKEWYGTQVTILAGPFMYRTGLVEKWGNGWVSVRIANVGGHEHQPDSEGQPRDVVGGGPPGTILHNRRAFELCVVQPRRNVSQQQQIGSQWPGANGSLMVS